MADNSDPPRKHYQLKPTQFEIVNAPSGAAPADSAPTHVRGHIRAANAEPKNAAVPTAAPRENDVHALLRANAERANAAGLNALAPQVPARSRRKKDYIFTLLLGNGAIIGLVLALGMNVMTVAFGAAGVLLFTLGTTWIMWFVMDRY